MPQLDLTTLWPRRCLDDTDGFPSLHWKYLLPSVWLTDVLQFTLYDQSSSLGLSPEPCRRLLVSPTSVKECRTPSAVKRNRLVVKSSVKILGSDRLYKEATLLFNSSLVRKGTMPSHRPPFSPAVLNTHRAETVSLLPSRVVEHHSVG